METCNSTKQMALPPIETVMDLWQQNGMKSRSAGAYRQWVNRFVLDCTQRGVSPLSHLNVVEAKAFAQRYARRQRINRHETQRMAQMSLYAWSVGLAALGVPTMRWSVPTPPARPLSPRVAAYAAFRHIHSNAAEISIRHEITAIQAWLKFLQSRRRPLRAIRLADVDAYLLMLRRRYAVATVAGHLSGLRLFFRFLHGTGKLGHDLASSIQSPARRRVEPPRALPWTACKRFYARWITARVPDCEIMPCC